MSYILDALKKNQAEQAETGVNLQPPRGGSSRWLAAGLVVVLVINLALLAWIVMDKSLLTDSDAPTGIVSTPQTAPTTAAAPVEETSPTTSGEVPETAAEIPAAAVARPVQPVDEPDPVRNVVIATADAPAQAPRDRALQPTALADLPTQEQILYNGFNYSTHIYTDDPELCAVVIDGERLTAGDSFKGLKVVAITETGVIFEESRRGQRRQVEVSVLEQWERQ